MTNRRTAQAPVLPAGQDSGLDGYTPPLPLERRRLQCYLALIAADILAIAAGFCVSGILYRSLSGLAQGGLMAQLVMPVFLTVGLYNGAYSLGALQWARAGALRALGALGFSAAFIVFLGYYTKSSTEISRVQFTGGIALAGLLLVWSRVQMRAFIRWRCGGRLLNELVIEDGGSAFELPGALRVDAGALDLAPMLDDPVQLNRIGAVLQNVDRVVINCAPEHRQAWTTILKSANIAGEVVDPIVAELGARGARIVDGQGLLNVSVGPLGLRARATKRLFDIIFAGAAIILLLPVLLLTAVAILLEDGSPVLFLQRRVGRANRFFTVYKFRSMRLATSDHHGARSAAPDDDRTTRVGRFIRRSSIDELPQLFNVLKGEMAIVGPRPHALGSQAGDKLFWEVDDRYWLRHALKPGLTGLAQVRGLRGATAHENDLSQRLGADLEYLTEWSLWRDIRIIVATIRVLVHDRAF